jgi:hypothetical protein
MQLLVYCTGASGDCGSSCHRWRLCWCARETIYVTLDQHIAQSLFISTCLTLSILYMILTLSSVPPHWILCSWGFDAASTPTCTPTPSIPAVPGINPAGMTVERVNRTCIVTPSTITHLITAGVSKHKQHPAVHLGPGAGGLGSQASTVTLTVPFSATAEVDMPPGRTLTCDAFFGDEQVHFVMIQCTWRVCQL